LVGKLNRLELQFIDQRSYSRTIRPSFGVNGGKIGYPSFGHQGKYFAKQFPASGIDALPFKTWVVSI